MNLRQNTFSLLSLFGISLFLASVAQADDAFHFQSNPGCVLHKFSNGVWSEGPASDLEGQALTLKPYGKFGTQLSTKVNGTWYYADKECFKNNVPASSASPTPAPLASASPTPVPGVFDPAKKVVRKAARTRKKYGIDLSASYWMLMSSSAKAQTTDFFIVSAALNKLSSMLGGKARFTYMLKSEHELSLGFGYTTGSRSGSIVGGGTDSSLSEQVSDTEISLGYRYLFGWNSFVPFLGANLSYNMIYKKDTIVVSSASGAAVGYSGNGIGYGITAGAYYTLSEKFRLVGDLNYSLVSAKLKVKETTDPISFVVGDEAGTFNLTHLGLNLGIGYCF